MSQAELDIEGVIERRRRAWRALEQMTVGWDDPPSKKAVQEALEDNLALVYEIKRLRQLEVTVIRPLNQPATCRVTRNGVVEFEGTDLSSTTTWRVDRDD